MSARKGSIESPVASSARCIVMKRRIDDKRASEEEETGDSIWRVDSSTVEHSRARD